LKDIDKNLKSIAKLDENLKKESTNADKKIRATLSNEQYKEFIEKKDQVKFNDPPISRGRGPFPGGGGPGPGSSAPRTQE